MTVLRTTTVTGAPGWQIRESRMHDGRTLITVHDPEGQEHGFRMTKDKHDIRRLADELLATSAVTSRIGAGHTVGDEVKL